VERNFNNRHNTKLPIYDRNLQEYFMSRLDFDHLRSKSLLQIVSFIVVPGLICPPQKKTCLITFGIVSYQFYQCFEKIELTGILPANIA
jgi:hypothetical protein